MNIKKKNLVLIIIATFVFATLLSCGIFAAVTRSVSFNLALKLDPQIYFALSMRIDYDGDGYNANEVYNQIQIDETKSYKIFDNSPNAQGLVSWATVNQNCIVLNQVLADGILSNLTIDSRFEITVTNLTDDNGNTQYLNLTLDYDGQKEVFKMDNGFGAVNMRYGVTSGDTSATKIFEIIPQTTLLNGYIQIPFLAEIDSNLRYTANIITNQYATMVRNSGTIKAGENYTAEFTSTQEKPYYHFVVNAYEETLVDDVLTIVEKEYTFTNRTGILELPADILLGNITINANSITEWNNEVLAYDPNATFSGGNGKSASTSYLLSTALDLCQMASNSRAGELYRDTYFKMTNDIILNEDYENYESWTEETTRLNEWEELSSFYGVFDGNNKTVYGLFQSSGYGFMWRNNNIVKNLTMSHGFVCAGWSTSGIVAGNMAGATIENCKNYMNITYSGTENEYYVAGICSTNYGKINNCHNYGKITGRNYVGGVVSLNLLNNTSSYALIINCSNHGEVYGVNHSVGGIAAQTYHRAGWNNCTHGGVLVNCYNTGKISGVKQVGGIAGCQHYLITTNCYNTGLVTRISGSDTRIGGIAGEFVAGTLKNCYYKSECVVDASGNAIGNDLEGTTAMADSNMKSSTFANTLTTNATALETIYDYLGGILVRQLSCKSWKVGADGYPTFA